jgi:hypothetical protein|tara:strand:+ start:3133 stop:3342 length:210 start_codon:yes stop_codon:yes gene_type:complete
MSSKGEHHMPTQVDCPTCGSKVEWSTKATYRPFCSERCKLIDLGEWANEEKAIPGEPAQIPEQSANDDF